MSTFTVRDAARGLLIQWQVIHALIIRETRTRFGKYRMGYIWALIEPMSTIGVMGGMMLLIERPDPLGDNIMLFLATGFMPFLLFRSVAGAGASAVGANKALLFFPQVQVLDLIFARTLLEFATLGAVFIVIFGGMALGAQTLAIDSVTNVLISLFLAGMMGSGFGLILCSIGLFSDAMAQISGMILRPMFWLSAIFFTINDMPPGARNFILYNPVVHCTELLRDGWYPKYTAHYANFSYPAYWCIGLFFVGLVMERVARRKVSEP